MGLTNWIFDIYQHSKIDEARKEAMEERAMGELALATKTLQRLMVEKGAARTTSSGTRS